MVMVKTWIMAWEEELADLEVTRVVVKVQNMIFITTVRIYFFKELENTIYFINKCIYLDRSNQNSDGDDDSLSSPPRCSNQQQYNRSRDKRTKLARKHCGGNSNSAPGDSDSRGGGNSQKQDECAIL